MGVPFEALLPYGIIVAMFGVTGAGLTAVKHFSNDGKKARWNRDLWDRVWLIYWLIAKYVMIWGHALIPPILRRLSVTPFVPLTRWFTVMERDLRITGSIRGQSGNALAPKGFEVSNPWKLEKRIF